MKVRTDVSFLSLQGTSTMGKKRHKYDDYVDLGAGYDENDSFIDNTDAVSFPVLRVLLYARTKNFERFL